MSTKKPVDTINKPSSIEEALAQQAAKDAGKETTPEESTTEETTNTETVATPAEPTSEAVEENETSEKTDVPSAEAESPAPTTATEAPATSTAEPATPAAEPTPTAAASATTPAPTAEPSYDPNATAIPTPTVTPAASTEPTPATTSPTSSQFEQLFPEPQVVVSGPPTWVWWILLVAGAAGVIFLAYDLTRQQLALSPTPTPSIEATPSSTPVETITPTAEPSATPTATPTATATAQVGTIRVLNGTTITGLAAAARAELTAASFTIRTIGNANSRTYTTTTIYYSSGSESLAQSVSTALGITTAPTESTLAAPDNVLVVVGTDRN